MTLFDSAGTRLLLGLMLCLVGCLCAERAVKPVPRVRARPRAAWVIHAGMVLCCFTLAALVTARPLFSAAVVVLLWGVLAAVSNAKFRALREPFVFSDFALFSQALRYPRLYLPFLALQESAAVAVAACAATYLGLRAEPPVTVSIVRSVFAFVVLSGLGFGAWLVRFGQRAALPVELDPMRDIERLGLIATLWLYRASESKPFAVPPSAYAPRDVGKQTRAGRFGQQEPPHIVVVQSESFFDARRLFPGIRADLLPQFDALSQCSEVGRLSVPAWGANTMRSEFSFLSGIKAEALGVHRFNPYRRLARTPTPSLAWHLAARGYRCLALHPHPVGFFGRDRVFPCLGFERFIDIDAFGAADHAGPYVSDAAVTDRVLDLLRNADDPIFLFVITMENHGPLHLESAAGREFAAWFSRDPPEGCTDLAVYLRHLINADRMLGRLQCFLETAQRDAVLCWYGDHVPSMPGVYRRFGYEDPRTDYLLWRKGRTEGRAEDLSVEELGAAVLRSARLRRPDIA